MSNELIVVKLSSMLSMEAIANSKDGRDAYVKNATNLLFRSAMSALASKIKASGFNCGRIEFIEINRSSNGNMYQELMIDCSFRPEGPGNSLHEIERVRAELNEAGKPKKKKAVKAKSIKKKPKIELIKSRDIDAKAFIKEIKDTLADSLAQPYYPVVNEIIYAPKDYIRARWLKIIVLGTPQNCVCKKDDIAEFEKVNLIGKPGNLRLVFAVSFGENTNSPLPVTEYTVEELQRACEILKKSAV